MVTTPIFGIPEIASQQDQPEVTHNEALILIQILMTGAEGQQNTPPGGPSEGQVYIVGDTPTGAWAGRPNKVAIYYGGAWRFLPGVDDSGSSIDIGATHEGIRVYRKDLSALTVWDGAAWVELAYPSL
ncbi:hypothetical protein TVVG_00007 [Tetraselmis viridis virus SI1]|uniref:hypothetical protein n=1 Tax=Tetraselmis viridis virus S20 TaxID=754070 RepID=UPI0002C055C7|nr:hypothetical protein TVGG_00028 [Tetraselmis viridis virus S20]AGH31356.1 hypothetical protein TVGG_00028 [Tetraselmis viridis virus S20]AGH31390.1 hypothetical protein TVVG_00007 [Tetraselmis viridis virus SI1]